MKLEFDAKTHRYLVDGEPVPSVTQIISAVLGQSWMAADWYLQRGRAVHACAALLAQGLDFSYDPQIEGQVKALRRFYSEVHPEVISTEEKMASAVYRYAGTPDLICLIEGTKTIIDFKASIDEERTALQLGGYAVLYGEQHKKPLHYGRGVEIRADGKYQMSKKINLRQARREFMALRGTYGIMERMNLLSKENKDDGN